MGEEDGMLSFGRGGKGEEDGGFGEPALFMIGRDANTPLAV